MDLTKKRRYFIIKIPNEHMNHSLDVCIGENETQVYSLDGTELFVKTNQELLNKKIKQGIGLDKIFPIGLTTEYTYNEIKIIMNGPSWSIPIT